MLRYFILTVFLFGLCHIALSQELVTGKVVNRSDALPIAYVNIGILNSPIGTISNEDGSFSISIPARYSQDTLLFSAVGYKVEKYSIKTLINRTNVIKLTEKVIVLKEVVVSQLPKKKITAILGSRVRIFGTQYGDSIAAGAAMALKVRSDKNPTNYPNLKPPLYIQEASLWISQNYLKQFRIRVRIFDIDSLTGLPNEDLLNESVTITSQIKKGWIKADLSKYNVAVNNTQFFVVFEWIMDDEARLEVMKQFREYKQLYPEKVRPDTTIINGEQVRFLHWEGIEAGVWFGASPADGVYLNNTECYFRTNSLAKWEKSYSIMAARVIVTNRPKND